MAKEEIKTVKAPEAIGPYSQAVKAGRTVFLSGQIPIDPATGEVITGTIADQARRVLSNLQMVVEQAGGCLDDIVKTTVYMTDLARFGEVNEVYAGFFNKPFPARATVEVSGLPKGVDVEIDAIAVFMDED
jgi:reactive intermediate/imine deaminase